MIEPIGLAAGRAGNVQAALLFLLIILSTSCARPANGADGATEIPAGKSGAGILDSNIVVRSVRVSQKLPPYRFVLTPDFSDSNSDGSPRHIGRIEISKGNSKQMLQSIDVEGPHGSWFTESFRTVDINFDGYLDFAVLYDLGGKYSRDSYWLFDPGSGRFITNALTAELRELAHRELTLEPQKKEIRLSYFIGVCLNSFEIFRVENGHLVLMESEIHSPKEPGRCVVEKRRRINGELVLIETAERQHEIPPSLREP